MQKQIWSDNQDKMFKSLKDDMQMQKWTDISRTLSQNYQIRNRNGRQCLQKYQQLYGNAQNGAYWTLTQEKTLFSLHNQIGNKWAVISRRIAGKSDNCIKNHFFSRLRKGLKRINLKAKQSLGEKQFKQIKFNVLFKIVEANEERFKQNVFCQEDTSRFCFGTFSLIGFSDLKNKIIFLSYYDEDQDNGVYYHENVLEKDVYDQIHSFSRKYKRKPKKFRRIPIQPEQLKKCQKQSLKVVEQVILESCKDARFDETDACKEINEAPNERSASIIQNPPFKQFEQDKSVSIRKNGARKQSAQTQGLSQLLIQSGIIELEEHQFWPCLKKKCSSQLQIVIQDEQSENMFMDDSKMDMGFLTLDGLLSMKRASNTDEVLFN